MLLHGYCGSAAYWDDLLPLLTAHARVVAPDARGHGETAATGGTYGMEQLAEDALQLLDALHIGQAFVLGHSMGGYAALALAERAPDRLLGLGLLHATTFADDENGKANRDKVAARIASEGMEGHIRDLVPKLFSPDNLARLQPQVDRALAIGFGTSPRRRHRGRARHESPSRPARRAGRARCSDPAAGGRVGQRHRPGQALPGLRSGRDARFARRRWTYGHDGATGGIRRSDPFVRLGRRAEAGSGRCLIATTSCG
ncbi:alpha/beta fold hydrolase [Cohnella rhizosphaerae]|uniref:Alpha/beta fold hydrolase n=1 Tax=Cohnella rhizosphaerae TaxID=1457232 RepID=A0A9X4KZ30_9BACL|nr:alpha/beta fold hydrolase [Cohnella rhizosphaerae]MDG0810864.1 alpha/beta fold hydrolase [Cohnella rhizosphaerae]